MHVAHLLYVSAQSFALIFNKITWEGFVITLFIIKFAN